MKSLPVSVAYWLMALGVILTCTTVLVIAQDEGYWAPVRVPVQAFIRPCNDDYCECVRWGLFLTIWRERYRAMDGPGGDFDLRDVARMMP